GRLHHQLRLVDRHRALGNAALSHPLSLPRAVPRRVLPLGRGDDADCYWDRGALPDPAPRAGMAVLLAAPLPERETPLGQLPLAADPGCLCDPDVPDRIDSLLLARAA